MCLQTVPSVTLNEAMLSTVKEFANAGKSFSVHDVTTAIRNKVRNGELEVPECEVSGASFKVDIKHQQVKILFINSWENGDFDSDFALNRVVSPNGLYFVYTATLNTPLPTPSVATTSPAVATANPVVAPTATVAPTAMKPDRVTIYNRVQEYLDNCADKNFRPSLKQVQSAIKRGARSTGWTCAELQDLIENDLDIEVVVNPNFVSESQVAVI